MPTTTAAHAPTHARWPVMAGPDADALASLPLGAVGGDTGVQALQRFHALMATEGHPVQITRMCFDRLYAYERIALAHASSDPALRQLALQLFHACHYSGSAQRTLS